VLEVASNSRDEWLICSYYELWPCEDTLMQRA
jgi:hypothetical protein